MQRPEYNTSHEAHRQTRGEVNLESTINVLGRSLNCFAIAACGKYGYLEWHICHTRDSVRNKVSEGRTSRPQLYHTTQKQHGSLERVVRWDLLSGNANMLWMERQRS